MYVSFIPWATGCIHAAGASIRLHLHKLPIVGVKQDTSLFEVSHGYLDKTFAGRQ